MELIKYGWRFDFMGYRRHFVALSAFLLIGSIVTMFIPGPKWGTDFRGGTEIEVAFKKNVEVEQVRAAVETSGFEAADVVTIPNKDNQFLIRVQEVSAISDQTKEIVQKKMCFTEGAAQDPACPETLRPNELKFSPGGDKLTARYDVEPDLTKIREQINGIPEVRLRDTQASVVLISARDHRVEIYLKSKGDQLLDGLREKLGADVAPEAALRVEWIGPKAGAQLRDAAIKSILVTVFFVMAYIALRFDLRFAPGAIISLSHDILIAIGAMCLTGREITLSTVAAVLTVLGYSISDTVVVYDRIRENLTKHRNMSFPELVNLSVSEMFGRTLITNLTVIVALSSFLFFGTQVIKDFAFVMLVGIGVGTYSSIYVAAPVTEYIDRKFFAGGILVKKKNKPPRRRSEKRSEAVV